MKRRPDSSNPQAVARDLRRRLRGDVEFDDITRYLYATDAGLNQIVPLGVVSPRDTEDVVRLVEYCASHGLSLVPRGAGSGLAGGAVGPGLQVDFSRYMNRVLEVGADGSWARVQPGVVMAALNQELRPRGIFFAPDPSSENYCTLGGMIGTNSSGARTVAYGGTIDHVLALEVVLADGRVLRAEPTSLEDAVSASESSGSLAGTAFPSFLAQLAAHRETIADAVPRVVKNCSGYRLEALLEDGPAGPIVHLERLFVGAEGTLGLVTEATLNLVPLPASRGLAMIYFPSVFACGEAIPSILELRPSAAEIMDARFLALVRRHDARVDAMLPRSTDTALLVEFEGRDEEEVAARFDELEQCLKDGPALAVVRAKNTTEQGHLWTVRKSAVALVLRMPGPRRALPFVEDVTVHPTEVAGYVDFLQKLFERTGVEAVMYGHVGDGNIHTRPLLDPKDPSDLRLLQTIFDEVFAYVRGVHGTMSGEHGDGLLRTPYVKDLYGPTVYRLFELVKQTFDPQGLLNPGKKIAQEETGQDLTKHLRYGATYRTVPQTPLLHFAPGGYEREVEKCHGCAHCKSLVATTMCPTYKATRREHASPRAKANLLRAVITGALDPKTIPGTAAFKAVTDLCLVCGMCAVECPSHVNIPKLMLEAKTRYRTFHRATLTDQVLGRPERTYRLVQRLAPLTNRALRNPALRRAGEALLGIDHRRSLPAFARPTFAESVSSLAEKPSQGPVGGVLIGREALRGASLPLPAAAYFYDLYANYNDPRLAALLVQLLRVHGVNVVIPPQVSAGIPEMLYGFAEDASGLIRQNLRALLPAVRGGAVLVTAEPTASFAFKVHYPDYAPSQECSLVAEAARDLGEFLWQYRQAHPGSSPPLRAPAAGPEARPLRVAYHQPCHLKAQEIGNPGRDLLAQVPGLEVIDLAAGCCGMAGTFGLKAENYDFSLQVGEPLFRRLREEAPDLVASECSTCRLQITQATGLPTVHPLELLAAGCGL